MTFGLDGVTYCLELTAREAEVLRATLMPYVQAARVSRRQETGAKRPSERDELSGDDAIRAWARGKGYRIPDHGPINGNIVDAYFEDLSGPTP
jgi:hypothetical protein